MTITAERPRATTPAHPWLLGSPEIRQIRQVVQGGRPLPLRGELRAVALEIMIALSYSTTYMGQQLGISPRSVRSAATRHGLAMEHDRDRGVVDLVGVRLVVEEGCPMRLREVSMDEALRRLAAAGRTVPDCCRLLLAERHVIDRRARQLGLKFTSALPESARTQ